MLCPPLNLSGTASGGIAGIALRPLTVAFHETPFLSKLNAESQLGPWLTLSDQQRQQLGSPWGPMNPQSLNRYSYVLNSPMRWTDPGGHQTYDKAGAGETVYDLRTTLIPALKDAVAVPALLAIIADVCGDLCAALIDTQFGNDDLIAILETIVNELEYFIRNAPDSATITILAQRYGPCGDPVGCKFTYQLHVAWSAGGHVKNYKLDARLYQHLVDLNLEHQTGHTDPLDRYLPGYDPSNPSIDWELPRYG